MISRTKRKNMKPYIITLTALLVGLFAISHQQHSSNASSSDSEGYTPPPGSNQMLRAPITIADGLEVIISDVVIPPNRVVPRHYHPGEEFIYVIEGSAVHIEEDKPDRILRAGDTYVIPPEAEHAPRGGDEGARAIVFRVHVEGNKERILVEE